MSQGSKIMLWRIAGVVVMGAIAVGIGVYNHAHQAQQSSNGQITKNGNLGVTSLQAGDCFQDSAANGAALSSVAAVSCSTPHNAQVVALVPVSGASYPGSAKLSSQAAAVCSPQFTENLNKLLITRTMSTAFFFPEQDTWDSGQHSISCIVSDSTPDLTESLLKPTG